MSIFMKIGKDHWGLLYCRLQCVFRKKKSDNFAKKPDVARCKQVQCISELEGKYFRYTFEKNCNFAKTPYTPDQQHNYLKNLVSSVKKYTFKSSYLMLM